MGKKQLTPEEQVTRWEHIRAIENLVGKMTYYGIHCWDEKIWEEMWAKKAEDITLGFNNGYYKGAEAIRGYYQASAELMKLRTEVVKAANPDKFADKTVEEIFGAGSLDVNNFTTPIVELAEDMKGKAEIVKVDVDQEGDLAMKFGIMSVPTMIAFKNGEAVKQISG